MSRGTRWLKLYYGLQIALGTVALLTAAALFLARSSWALFVLALGAATIVYAVLNLRAQTSGSSDKGSGPLKHEKSEKLGSE